MSYCLDMSQLLYISIVCLIACLIAKKYSDNTNEERSTDDSQSRDVATQFGVIRGYLAEDGDYFAFLGIPYAGAPIGENRFKAPLPPPHWQGVLIANHTIKCPQNGEGDEDCLILNIFTPTHDDDQPKPVLFYIHGGSFLLGSGQTNGVNPLIEQNVIVVTVNYRLGALGFLCLGTEEAPGNVGLKDQLAALTWIYENIHHFGGDPSKITLYGMSAGAASVELHVLSNKAKEMIQNAIIESASAISVWGIDEDPIKTAKNAARYLKFPVTENMTELVYYYQNVSADVLSTANYNYYNSLTGGTFGFVPCIERKLNNIEPFLTDDPYKILIEKKYDKIPIMFIFTSCEGLFLRSEDYYANQYKEKIRANFVDFVPDDLIFVSNETKKEVAKTMKQYYFGDKDVDDDMKMEYLNYFGDSLILHSLLDSVEIHSNDNLVYLMEFAYKGNLGSHDYFYKEISFAGHGDTVKHAILKKPISTESDNVAVQRISTLIGNFVTFGNPTPHQTQLLPLLWPRVLPTYVSYYRIDKGIQVLTNPYWKRKKFWDNIYRKYRRPPVQPVGQVTRNTQVNYMYESVKNLIHYFHI